MQKECYINNLSRRDLLRYSGLAGFVGFTGFTGLQFGSEPAIAEPTGAPSIVDGTVAGDYQVSSYGIEYQNLETSSDIVISYIFTDSNGNEATSTHSVSLSGESADGTISTGSHNVTVPSGDIQLEIEVSHPSLSSEVSTNSSSVTTVYPDIIDASGGSNVTTFTDSDDKKYRIHAFENVGNSTFNVNRAPSDATVDVLVVGGGGGGGTRIGGGGGAGELIFQQSFDVSGGGNFTVKTANGGDGAPGGNAGKGGKGGDSVFDTLVAKGGGGGGAAGSGISNRVGNDGGSGGGAAGDSSISPSGGVSTADVGFGNDGGKGDTYNYEAGGGGGALTRGDDASSKIGGDGGNGRNYSGHFSTRFGDNGVFSGGGGGGSRREHLNGGGRAGFGGEGGGVNGAESQSQPPSAPSGTGGGGGGGFFDGDEHPGGDGGSGIVLIRYRI